MTSVASIELQAMIDEVHATFGEVASYQPLTGGPSTPSIVVDRALGRYGEIARVAAHTAVVRVRTSQVVAPPRRGETFTLASAEVLTVDSIVSSDAFEHRVLVA